MRLVGLLAFLVAIVAVCATPASGDVGSRIWPVNGPVTSPFGMRWGEMHEGIDVGVGYGTPIHAAAAGRVVSEACFDASLAPADRGLTQAVSPL